MRNCGRQEDVGKHNSPANYAMTANATNELIHYRDTTASNLKEAREKLAQDATTSSAHDLPCASGTRSYAAPNAKSGAGSHNFQPQICVMPKMRPSLSP